MSTATLSDIITKVRKLTGTGNSLQLTDSTIVDYINSFYLYDFPSEFRSLQLKQTFSFNTRQNVDTYPFDFEHYQSLEAPAYVDKRLVPLYTSPWPFYSLFFNWEQKEVLDIGDGTTDNSGAGYSGTVQDFPINRSYNNNPAVESLALPTASFAIGTYPQSYSEPNPARVQNILIEANTATKTVYATDDGNGNLIGVTGVSGTINYLTGAVSNLIFDTAIPSGNDIYIHYNPTNASIPQAILFWQNQLTLRPVPDRGYTVEIVSYRRPSQVLLGSSDSQTGVPELLEWWETLAAGAAKKIFEDRQDMDGVQMMDKMLMERYALNETRTYAQLGKQSMNSIFRDQLSGFSGGFIPFGGNNG